MLNFQSPKSWINISPLRSTLVIKLMLPIIFGLSACSSTPESQLSDRWIIMSIAEQDILKQHTPWIEFDTNFETNEGDMKGHSGCNRFFARYKLSDGQIAFSPIGSTRKACPGPEMKQESALFKLLTTTMQLEIKMRTHYYLFIMKKL